MPKKITLLIVGVLALLLGLAIFFVYSGFTNGNAILSLFQNNEINNTALVTPTTSTAPTASLLLNGKSGEVTVYTNRYSTYSWSSTNAQKALSSSVIDPSSTNPSCPALPKIANNISGSYQMFITANMAGCKYVITYVPFQSVTLLKATSVLKVNISNFPAMTVIYPNQTETFYFGQKVKLEWNGSSLPKGGSLLLILNKIPAEKGAINQYKISTITDFTLKSYE